MFIEHETMQGEAVDLPIDLYKWPYILYTTLFHEADDWMLLHDGQTRAGSMFEKLDYK